MVVGFCLFVRFCILLSILRPNCTCMQLFLVPYSFFVFCCLRRHLSRCRRCSKGSQVPACLNRTLGLFPTSQPATHRLRWNLGGGQHDCVPNRQPKPQGFPSTCSFLSGQFERKQEMSSTSLCQHLPQLESKGLSFFFFLIYFWLCWVFIAVRAFSSCGKWGLLFHAVRGLLIVVASLVAEHGL